MGFFDKLKSTLGEYREIYQNAKISTMIYPSEQLPDFRGDDMRELFLVKDAPISDLETGDHVLLKPSKEDMELPSITSGTLLDSKKMNDCVFTRNGRPVGMLNGPGWIFKTMARFGFDFALDAVAIKMRDTLDGVTPRLAVYLRDYDQIKKWWYMQTCCINVPLPFGDMTKLYLDPEDLKNPVEYGKHSCFNAQLKKSRGSTYGLIWDGNRVATLRTRPRNPYDDEEREQAQELKENVGRPIRVATLEQGQRRRDGFPYTRVMLLWE